MLNFAKWDSNAWKEAIAGGLVGTAAGAIGTATFGVGLAAMGGGGFIAGAAAGAFSYAATMPVLTVGNNIAFGDPLPTPGEYFAGMGLAALGSGVVSGLSSTANGNNFMTGRPSELSQIQQAQIEAINEGQRVPMPAASNIDEVLT